MSKKVNKTEPTMQQSNSVKNTMVNAYFNFVIHTERDYKYGYTIRIYNIFKDMHPYTFELYPSTYLLSPEIGAHPLVGDKVLSILVTFDKITLEEYYKMAYIVERDYSELCRRFDEFILLGTDHSMNSLDQIYYNTDCINLYKSDFLIKRTAGEKYLFRDRTDKLLIPAGAKTKILVYGIDLQSSYEYASYLNSIFEDYHYTTNKFTPVNPSYVENVYHSTDAINPVKNVICYCQEYFGDVSLYKNCIKNVIELAKRRVNVIGIVILNELNEHEMVYKSNSAYHFHFTGLIKDKSRDIFEKIVL